MYNVKAALFSVTLIKLDIVDDLI